MRLGGRKDKQTTVRLAGLLRSPVKASSPVTSSENNQDWVVRRLLPIRQTPGGVGAGIYGTERVGGEGLWCLPALSFTPTGPPCVPLSKGNPLLMSQGVGVALFTKQVNSGETGPN